MDRDEAEKLVDAYIKAFGELSTAMLRADARGMAEASTKLKHTREVLINIILKRRRTMNYEKMDIYELSEQSAIERSMDQRAQPCVCGEASIKFIALRFSNISEYYVCPSCRSLFRYKISCSGRGHAHSHYVSSGPKAWGGNKW